MHVDHTAQHLLFNNLPSAFSVGLLLLDTDKMRTPHVLLSVLIFSCLDVTAKAFTPLTSLERHSISSNVDTGFHRKLFAPRFPQPYHSKKNHDRIKFLQRRKSDSTLTTMSATPAALAAITGAITGGLFSGGLHAIAGEFFFILFCFICIIGWMKDSVFFLWLVGHASACIGCKCYLDVASSGLVG